MNATTKNKELETLALDWLRVYRSHALTYHVANAIGMRGKTTPVRTAMKRLVAAGLVKGRKLANQWEWKAV